MSDINNCHLQAARSCLDWMFSFHYHYPLGYGTFSRDVKQLITLTTLIFKGTTLIAVLTHILFVCHSQVDIIVSLLLNASLLRVLTTDYSD